MQTKNDSAHEHISDGQAASKRKLLVTSALPYSNGDLHIGHLVEYLQTDFWVRMHRMMGRECIYICADDTHGTPIMIAAKKEGIDPKQLIEKNRQQHMEDFEKFGIAFSHYGSTDCEENKELSNYFFCRNGKAGTYRKKDHRADLLRSG